jgi:hypothetical membrane protein
MRSLDLRYYTLAVAWILVVILIAHLLVPPPYQWTQNTISELAAQGYSLAWIMRLGFTGFGALASLGAIHRLAANPRHNWPEVGILLYALAILLSGVFSTTPFQAGVDYSETEAGLHSIMATSAGIAISLAMLLCGLLEQRRTPRIVHLSALTLTLLLSSLFGAFPAKAGIIQRGLYIVGFGWLVYLEEETHSPVGNLT